MEINAELVINELLNQNKQLVAEIAIIRAALAQLNQEESNEFPQE